MFKPSARPLHLLGPAIAAALVMSGCGYSAPQQLALPADQTGALLQPDNMGALGSRVPSGTVTGRIVDDRTKMGIPGVIIQVQNVSPPVTAQTDSSGNFVLNNVPQGDQFLVVNKVGYVYMATQGSITAHVVPNSTMALPQIVLSPAIAAASNAYLTSIGGLVEPYGLAVDNNHGFLYAVDRIGFNSLLDKRCEVKKFNLTGGFVKKFGGDELKVSKGNDSGSFFDFFTHLSWSYGIDVDAGGNVYVAEANKDRVVKFSANGDYITNFSDNIKNDFDVAVQTTGQIAVSSSGNNKVEMFDVNLQASGQDFSGTAGMPSVNGGFRGLAVDNANYLYLIDNSAGPGGAIKKYIGNGGRPVLQFGTNSGAGPSQFNGATDIAVDNRNGDIYVVDSGNNRVQRFDRDGRFVSEFGSAGRGDGQFDRPYGIAIDKDGYVFVADSGNKRIQKFAPGRILDAPYSANSTYYPTK